MAEVNWSKKMLRQIRPISKTSAISIALLVLVAWASVVGVPASAAADGSFQFTVSGYSVTGQLSNAIVKPDNSVSMNMIVDGSVQTPIGPAPIRASGIWDGALRGVELSGTIHDVTGTIHACFFVWCGDTNYVGSGQWNGQLNESQVTGTITFTSSPFPQIPLNQPQPVQGTWTANFTTTNNQNTQYNA
jgi:hypothetical protein